MNWERIERGCVAALLFLILPGVVGAQECPPALPVPSAGSQELLLSLREPGVAEPDEPDRVLLTPDRRVWIEAEVLARWRVPLPAESLENSGVHWYPLDRAQIAYRADDCAQALVIDLSGSAREPIRYALRGPAQYVEPDPAAPGGFVNLDVGYTHVPTGGRTSGIVDAGVFNERGYGGQNFLVRDSGAVRLDTWWSMEDRAQPRTLRFGDAVGRSGVWGRSVRYGGVQWATDYGLLPFFPTFPMPSISGDAKVPSTLEVFINQSLVSRTPVQSGPFELSEVPVVSGAGEVRVAVPDLLGRQTYLTQSFYQAPQLLREGLNDIAIEGGWLRRNYGSRSDDYGPPFASLTHRRGMRDDFTLETRLEMQPQQGALGESAYVLLDSLALASATLAYGSGTRGGGLLGGVGLERQVAGGYSVFGQTQWAEPGFSQLGESLSALPPRRRDVLGASFTPHLNGTLSLSWVDEDRRAATPFQLLSLAYNLRLTTDWSFFATAQEVRQGAHYESLVLGLTWLLDQNRVVSAQSQRQTAAGYTNRAEFQQNLRKPLDYGYRLAVERHGDRSRELGSGTWREEHGQLTADVTHDEQGANFRLGGATALANIGDRFYWTRPVQNSFAVVDTGALAGVGVLFENLPVGHTGRDGTLLVPDLRANQTNTFVLDPGDIPLEATVPRMSRSVVAPTRGGVRLVFPVETRASALLRVRLADGGELPAGARVLDTGTGQLVPVGPGGEIYVQAPGVKRLLRVWWSGQSCVIHLGAGAEGSGAAAPDLICVAR